MRTELDVLQCLELDEEEHADEDEVQEEEGDEADQAIPEDEQPTRHTETRRRVICNLPDTFLDWVSLIPLVKLRYQGSHVPSVLPFYFSGGPCVVLVSPLISRLEPPRCLVVCIFSKMTCGNDEQKKQFMRYAEVGRMETKWSCVFTG